MRDTLANFLASWIGKKIHVVGLGSTECTALLQVLPESLRKNVHIHDFSADEEEVRKGFMSTHVALPKEKRVALLEDLLSRYPNRHLRAEYLKGFDEADILFLPQSWDLYAPNEPIKEWIESHPERVFTLMDLYLRLLPCQVVGVTGTNGKTTVTSMLSALAEDAGKEVIVSGNHRYHSQLLPEIDRVSPDAVAVLEISHKHLSRLQEGPDIAVLTNVSGDHLDQFDSFEAYASRKRRIIEVQDAGSVAIVNGRDPECRKALEGFEGTLYSIGAPIDGCQWTGTLSADSLSFQNEQGELVFTGPRANLGVPGEHNGENMLMALAALHALDIPWERAFSGASKFRGVKHRLEYLRRLEGVPIYDDTAATSPSATIAAIRALLPEYENLFLVVGGEAKGNDYKELQALISTQNIRVFGLEGETSQLLMGAEGSLCDSLKSALEHALSEAQGKGVILVSPAGAGFHSAQSEGSGPGLRQLVRRWGR